LGATASTVVKTFKAPTAHCINTHLGKSGALWQKSFYDHALWEEEDIRAIARYIVANVTVSLGVTYYEVKGRHAGSLFSCVSINIFNISKINSEVRGGKSPRIKCLSEYLGDSYFNYLAQLPDLVLLMDGIRLHEATKVELLTYYAHENDVAIIKPFMLVIGRDTTHAAQLLELMESAAFFESRYKGKIIQV
jgi:hypothetical protein